MNLLPTDHETLKRREREISCFVESISKRSFEEALRAHECGYHNQLMAAFLVCQSALPRAGKGNAEPSDSLTLVVLAWPWNAEDWTGGCL